MSKATIALSKEINRLANLISEFESSPQDSVWFKDANQALRILVRAKSLAEDLPTTCSKKIYRSTKLGNEVCGKPLPSHADEICSDCADADGP